MSRKRILVAAALAALLCMVALVAILARLRAQPEWYAPVSEASSELVAEAGDRAERFEYDLAVSVQRIRTADATWTLELRDAEINAWLATRLDDWLVQQGGDPRPRELGVPQIRTTADGVQVGLPIRVGTGAFAQARVVPRIDGSSLVLDVEDAALGGFAYDGLDEALAEIASAHGEESIAAIGLDRAALRRGEVRAVPELSLADGRRVRIEGVALDDGAVVLTVRTLPAS